VTGRTRDNEENVLQPFFRQEAAAAAAPFSSIVPSLSQFSTKPLLEI
jgi:hypothetical protein